MTAQQALGILRDEGLVISRQGKCSFVRQRTERASALRTPSNTRPRSTLPRRRERAQRHIGSGW